MPAMRRNDRRGPGIMTVLVEAGAGLAEYATAGAHKDREAAAARTNRERGDFTANTSPESLQALRHLTDRNQGSFHEPETCASLENRKSITTLISCTAVFLIFSFVGQNTPAVSSRRSPASRSLRSIGPIARPNSTPVGCRLPECFLWLNCTASVSFVRKWSKKSL